MELFKRKFIKFEKIKIVNLNIMVKLKTVPNQGTKSIHFPFVGDVKMENGVFEVEDSVASKLSGMSFGKFQVVDVNGSTSVKKTDETEEEDENAEDESSENGMTLEQLSSLRVVDLQEIFDQLEEAGATTDEEKEEYNKMKKPERVQFIFNKMNAAE